MNTCSRTTNGGNGETMGTLTTSKNGSPDEICAELSRLSNDLSSLVLSHGEIDFYIYRLEQIWRVLFHIYYEYSGGNNAFDDGLVLQHIRHAILCLNECNRVLDLLYRCPVDQSGMAGRQGSVGIPH